MFRIAIAGGGIGGSALISLLRGDPNAALVGIYEPKQEAPGVILAGKWNIPVFSEIKSLVAANPEIVLNLTGNIEVSNEIRKVFNDKIEVIEGIGARFIWEIIEKQKRARIEVIKTTADQKTLYNLAAKLCSSDSVKDFYEMMLSRALDIADAQAALFYMRTDR